MSEARDVILEHRERIVTGGLTWVPRKPDRPGECCVGYVYAPDGLLPLGDKRATIVAEFVLTAEALARGELSFDTWNDHVCRTPQQAVEFLACAAERCDDYEPVGRGA